VKRRGEAKQGSDVANELTGCSDQASSFQLPDASASCLAARIFPLYRRWSFEAPRISHPSALQQMNLRVAPHLLCCDTLMRPRLPAAASSGIAGGEFAGCPALPLPRLPLAVAAASCLAQRTLRRLHRCVREVPRRLPRGVSHVLQPWLGRCDSPAGDEPCIRGMAVDESSLPAGSCTFPAGSGCNLD
jgi:hypothetical protein